MRRASYNAAKNMRDTVKQRATVVCQLGRRILLVSREGTRWSLPGGKPEAGEDLYETALRELMEETRLRATDMRYMFGFTGIHTCHHVFVAMLADGEQPVPSNEITRCTWAKVTEVASLPVSISTKGIVEVLTIASNGASRLPAEFGRAANIGASFPR
jgi:8-oxo-dGTP pyrophosphatase MutT (NUDIX family)